MPKITIYYKSEEPAKGQDIYNACGIFKKLNLPVLKMKDEIDNEPGLRRIVYEFPLGQYMPSDDDLDDAFSEIIKKCNLNIRKMYCEDKFNKSFEVTVRSDE